MASLARIVQKNILKRRGFFRNPKDGLIYNSKNEELGKHFPLFFIKKEG